MRPLHHACNKNSEKVIRLLLKSGADSNAPDEVFILDIILSFDQFIMSTLHTIN